MANKLIHQNAGGMMGGNALCGNDKEGNVTTAEERVNCQHCQEIMRTWYKSKGKEIPTYLQKPCLKH